MIDDLVLRQLAAEQHGLVSIQQSVDARYGERQRDHLVDDRRWERVTPRVLRLVGSPATTAPRVMCAVLEGGADAALAGSTSMAWWGAVGNPLEPFQVHRQRGHVKRPERIATRHEPLLLPAHHVVRLDGVRTVVPARALFDIAGTQRRGAELPWWIERMARMVDSAWSARLVSGASLHLMLDEMAQRGRPGIRVMRQVLADRPVTYVPPASGLESRFVQILERAGRPPLRRQVDTGDDGRWIGRVDFRDAILPLIVEVQSERFHTSQIDRQLDATRVKRLIAAGFTVVEVTDTEVWLRPDVALAKVDAGRAKARRSRAA